MKKLLRPFKLFALSISLVALAACGTSQETAQDDNGQAGEVAEEAIKLVAGTDAAFAPFEFLDKGEIVGFDADILAAISEVAGIEIEMRNVGWEPLFPSVVNGDIQIGASAITITEDRLQTYDFSNPYFASTHMIVFKEGTDISNALDLVGKRIGVQIATTGESAAVKVLEEHGGDINAISKYENTAVAFMALQSGDVEAVVTDLAVVVEFTENNPNSGFVAISDAENFEAEYYGLMFQKDSEYRSIINEALKTIMENGTYEEIYAKWFGEEDKPNVELLLEIAE